ncbi:MAG: tRNA (adenosine(37)-N6)-threonylcarbamoyltransferase complex dimerization subunit type 1 TsaB [Alphaproteobacteria bacterium]|nr:tRNA (adenosine(37)-N6)-threonylcarbamoyltransferase complex dimerization subunit type 1 TsaB [Alphaproteobacteria bacterium]
MDNMLILAIDSAGAGCGVGVWRDGVVVARAQEAMERGQDARLVPMIIGVMKDAGAEFPQLDKIAVTRGPGSFTGLRVGLATARGIGLAAGKQVIGIDRFAIYRALRPNGDLLAVIDSRRAEMFCRFFEGSTAHEPSLMTQEQIGAFKTAHPNAQIAGDKATPADDILAACALLASTADAMHPDYLPRPLYLREPDVTFASAKSR